MALQQKTMLFKAIRTNDTHTVKSFLATKFNPQLLSANDLGFHLLRKSIKYNRTEITRLLLDHGCRAGSSSFVGDSPLHLAVGEKRNGRGLVKRLLENGARIGQRNHRNETALHAAFDTLADNKFIQLLLKEHLKRSLLNEINSDGLSYLHIACASTGLECVRKFVEQGGADVNAQVTGPNSPYAGSTPLHMAVVFGRFEVIEYLLERGANIYISDCEGSTPVHLALETRDTGVIDLMFEHDDAKLNCVNKYGLSHFMAACACDSPAVAQNFLANRFRGDEFLSMNEVVEGDDETEYDLKGFTPLHFAAMFGRYDTVKYLLNEGADCCAANHCKISSADIAVDYGFEDVADHIKAHCQGYHWISGI